MIKIQPAIPEQVASVKQMILIVAREIFQWKESIEELSCMYLENGEFGDLEDITASYFCRKGLFLVVLDDDVVVGSGGVRELEGDTCELKRLWLLDEYQGRKIGYELTCILLYFASNQGFKRVQLVTSFKQEKAIKFYQRFGFRLVSKSGVDDDYLYEMEL